MLSNPHIRRAALWAAGCLLAGGSAAWGRQGNQAEQDIRTEQDNPAERHVLPRGGTVVGHEAFRAWRAPGTALTGAPGTALRGTPPVRTAVRPAEDATFSDANAAVLKMASRAAVIFAGHVLAVTRQDAAGFVDVKFRIDRAVRGCPKTGVYVLREWAGLWSGGEAGGPERYRVGQRLLMLLRARGASGMSGPVGGTDGAIPLLSAGLEPLADEEGVAPAEQDAGGGGAASARDLTAALVDLRWVRARLVTRGVVPDPAGSRRREIAVKPRSFASAGIAGEAALWEGNGVWRGPVAALAGSSGTPRPRVQTATRLGREKGAGVGQKGPLVSGPAEAAHADAKDVLRAQAAPERADRIRPRLPLPGRAKVAARVGPGSIEDPGWQRPGEPVTGPAGTAAASSDATITLATVLTWFGDFGGGGHARQ